MANQELIEGLNHALNREVSTFLRYMLQGATIKGAPWESVRELYRREVQDEIGHAQYLADKIVTLGGTPKLEPDLTPPPTRVEAMLKNDIEQEHMDVEHYNKMAAFAEKLGLPELKIRMEEQAADKQRHGEELARMLG